MQKKFGIAMKKMQFSTNLKCGGCVAKITPLLQELQSITKWDVDLTDPKKTLTVEGGASQEEVIDALKKAGFNAQIFA